MTNLVVGADIAFCHGAAVLMSPDGPLGVQTVSVPARRKRKRSADETFAEYVNRGREEHELACVEFQARIATEYDAGPVRLAVELFPEKMRRDRGVGRMETAAAAWWAGMWGPWPVQYIEIGDWRRACFGRTAVAACRGDADKLKALAVRMANAKGWGAALALDGRPKALVGDVAEAAWIGWRGLKLLERRRVA